jgi:lysophospholipase L1-like esterase
MAMIDTRTLKKKQPLGRVLKERLSQEQRNLYRSRSPNNGNNSDGCRWIRLLIVVAVGCGLFFYFNGQPETTISLSDAKAAVTGTSPEGTSVQPSVSVAIGVKETDDQATTTSQIVEDIDDNGDFSSHPIDVVPLSTIKDRPIRIFCYGDSLTAGVAPPTRALFPYAETLKKSLVDKAKSDGKQISFEVEHTGFPGWTALELENQLKSSTKNEVQTTLLQRDPNKPDSSYFDILIYLAGTNDLGREETEQSIATAVLNVHAWAHHIARIPFTIAIPIPPSSFQSRQPQFGQRAAKVNKSLQAVVRKNFPHFSTTSACTLWAPFPIPLDGGDNNKEAWASDGLHLSQSGYQQLGEYLASVIYERMIK